MRKSDSKTAVAKFRLALPGVITANSYDLPRTMDYPAWAEVLRKVVQIRDASNWWTGAMLNHGGDAFGEQYAQAASETGLSEDTLSILQYVESRVPPANRVQGLSWSHHREVAKLPPEEQLTWLTRARDGDWSVRELVEALRSEGKRKPRKEAAEAVKPVCVLCEANEGMEWVCPECLKSCRAEG